MDHLSNGRLTFGAALGYQALDFTTFGEEYDLNIRAEKLDESLEVLKGLWSGEVFSFHGKHYQLNDAQMLPKSVQSPRIPVWLAGGWPKRKPLRRAAHWDGIYLMTVNQITGELLKVEEIRQAVTYIKDHRESSDPFDVAVNGEIPAGAQNRSEIIQAYEEAGATWWVELEGEGESFEEYRARIRRGPPK